MVPFIGRAAMALSDCAQGLFHDARYQGLYGGRGTREVRRLKGLGEKDNLFDFAGALELSAHEFQMNLAANVLGKDNIKGEQQAITRNRRVGEHVRTTIKNSGGTLPEILKLEEPIKIVRKRLGATKALPKSPFEKWLNGVCGRDSS